MPVSHAWSPLRHHPKLRDIHIERLLGAKRGENRWVQQLINVVVGITPPILNPV
jgi:hypothetical protein